MAWSFPLFTLGGTVVRVHLAFFLLLVWVGAVSATQGGLPAAVDGIFFVILIFVCVIAHEFGHVFAAKRYGIETPDITVLPIGGLARLSRMPERPGQELIVALAGPAVNVVIAAALIGVVGARFDVSDVEQIEQVQMSLAARLAAVNIMLVVFNLVPAFPLDGGRVFRALLSFRMPRHKATRWAAFVGQGFAVLFAVVGLMYNPILVLIAIFMFLAAEAESGHESEQARAERHAARDAMITRYESLAPSDTAGRAAELLVVTTQQQFPVLDGDGGLAGWVTRENLVEALSGKGAGAPVRSFMEADTATVAPGMPLRRVLEMLMQAPAGAVGVEGGEGGLVGFVNRENASELFAIEAARMEHAAGRPGAGRGPWQKGTARG